MKKISKIIENSIPRALDILVKTKIS